MEGDLLAVPADAARIASIATTIEAYAWSLRPIFEECMRVLRPGGRLVLQTRDVRLRSRLVPVESIHREVCGVLQTLLTQRWPAFVWGPPGTGKSSIVREVADSAKLPVIDLRASLLDPTDLRGIPAIDGGRAVWCPPSFLPRPQDTPGVLFLDEINAAPPLVQASLYQLVLDRRVGEYELPHGWWIVAAGNRQQDRAVTFRMSSALANRFVHVSLEVDVDDWRAWAIEKALDPMVVSFIGFKPALLCEVPADSPAYATPRSWQMLSDVITSFGSVKACSDLIPGIVGEGAAREFAAFVRNAASIKQIEAVIADPQGAPSA